MVDLSGLPRVDDLLATDELEGWVEDVGRAVVVDEVRDVLNVARELALESGTVSTRDEVLDTAVTRLGARRQAGVQAVVNATGVLLHTNLGRAPLSAGAIEAVVAAAGACSVELDLATGRRGSRTAHVGDLAAQLFGTQAATVVNNGAAALMLTLAALAADTRTIVSRGELIEIGGSYRLPDVITATGTIMVEVGTTNRTHTRDYERAASDAPGAVLLKVHPSNYAVQGFTTEADVAALRTVADQHDALLVVDLGSGLLTDHGGVFADEPSIAAAVRDGADLVICSGDKLLGGPQAGIIAGRADLVDRCRRHPLARAVRIDKLQRAAFEATLHAHHRHPTGLTPELPLGAMLATTTDELRARAEAVGGDLEVTVATMDSVVGGGSLPGQSLPSVGLVIADPDGHHAASLRTYGVIGRLHQGACHLDLRTVPPAADVVLHDALAAVLPARDASSTGPARAPESDDVQP